MNYGIQTEIIIKIGVLKLAQVDWWFGYLDSSAKLSTHKLYSYKRNLDLDTAYCANSKTDNLNISRNLKFAVQIQEFAMTRWAACQKCKIKAGLMGVL